MWPGFQTFRVDRSRKSEGVSSVISDIYVSFPRPHQNSVHLHVHANYLPDVIALVFDPHPNQLPDLGTVFKRTLTYGSFSTICLAVVWVCFILTSDKGEEICTA